METTSTAADLLKPIADEIGKSIIVSLKREINYTCCFNKNVGSFKEQVKELEDEREEVQEKVDAAERNSKRIVPKVKTWLKDATEFQVKIAEIEADIPKQKGCLNMLSRFSLSKKTKRTAEAIGRLRNKSKFDTISVDELPPSVYLFPLRHNILLPSRKQIEDEIVKTLIIPEVNIMGITGIEGVGKTTMAEKIIHRMKKENLVDETVKVVISQPLDMLKVQQDIAEYVGNKDLIGVKSLLVRAHKLRISLTRGKKILIILDNIWEEFKLEDIGIPCESGSNGCITLLTSRDRRLLNLMGAKVYAVETLCPDESWTLFRETIGTCADNPALACTARDIVKECEGLPIAIVKIGKLLKDQPKETWKDALPQLKKSRPDTLPKVLNNVYMPLKFSYESSEEFPKLEELRLEKSSSLKTLGKHIQTTELPVLWDLYIQNCPNWRRSINVSGVGNIYEEDDNESLHLFCQKDTTHLTIEGYNNVNKMWCKQTPMDFFTLNGLEIFLCREIRSICSYSIVQNFVNLKWLEIKNCNEMEQLVIAKDEINKTTHLITFPNLKTLEFMNLPNLTSLGKGIELMEFPKLTYPWIKNCSDLTTIVSPHQNHTDKANNEYLPVLFDEKVKFDQLKQVQIHMCNKIIRLFSPSMVESLRSLKEVYIYDCNNIERVIANEKVIHENSKLFPSLVTLELGKLLSSKILCKWKCDLQLPSLEWIYVYGCPLMEALASGLVSIPKLKEFSEEEVNGMEDLNGFLHQHIMSTMEASTSSMVMDCEEISEEEIGVEIGEKQF